MNKYPFIVLTLFLAMQPAPAQQQLSPTTVKPHEAQKQLDEFQPATAASRAHCCCGQSGFGSRENIDEFLDGKTDTLCGYDPGMIPDRIYGDDGKDSLPPFWSIDESKWMDRY
jgi:hypothetical protein